MPRKSTPKPLPRTSRCCVVPDGRLFKVECLNIYIGNTPIGGRLIRNSGSISAPSLDVWGKSLEEATKLMYEWTDFLDRQDLEIAKRKGKKNR